MPGDVSDANKNYIERVVPFIAGDGMPLNLINVRGQHPPNKGPVLLVHGAGVRANIFRAPVTETIVDTLVAAGYDVWLENWRASIDFPPNQWTLDQAALYDHPQAVKKVVAETGSQTIKAIIHCQGSTSFTMSAIAGLVPEVTTIITNAVSLNPIVSWWSTFKLNCLVPIVKLCTQYLNPHWGVDAPNWFAKLITFIVNIFHHECNNAVCKQVSFTYGSGFPALWKHENLSEKTHEWLKEEFKAVPLTFFNQITRCVRKGHLVGIEGLPGLPVDYTQTPPKTDARFAFFAGKKNQCFLAQSQVEAFNYFDNLKKGYHTLHLIENYSHLDIFMGTDAAQDVFPLMIQELAK